MSDGTKYTTRGKVHSGDPNTSLGNTLMALISAIYTCVKLKLHFRIIALGDDMLIMTREPFPKELFVESQEVDFGIITKCKVSSHPVDCEFLSSHPLPAFYSSREIWAMTPMVGKCLPKLYFWQEPIPFIPTFDWLRGVNNTMNATANHNPVIAAFVSSTAKLLPPGPSYYDKFSTAKIKYKMAGCPGLQQHPIAMEWLRKRYGLWFDLAFAELQTALDDVKTLPTLLPYCSFSTFTERDI